MIVLYNSDSFAVMQIDLPATSGDAVSGIEIVDKQTRKGIFLDGELAELFRAQVEALADDDEIDPADIDAHLARYTGAGWQPTVLH
ncbi:DUF3567 family protein [Ideonella sp. 4Y16]|uniref:DUF3567 family protein n=1 Tax=Ideonella alba TaxID=2824118 RepID=A0A941B9Y6_9BURK|nr:DUF3567 family protein [Ideonella alba]MBQ0929250.1 DUF3567 family protein [Ideonella alba]MBQ0945361.1 DUF3567 family protein [Ideonella alba]